jgi:hypothetical protein
LLLCCNVASTVGNGHMLYCEQSPSETTVLFQSSMFNDTIS